MFLNNDLEIVNPDHYAHSIERSASSDDFDCKRRSAWLCSSDQNKKDDAPVGTLAVDSI